MSGIRWSLKTEGSKTGVQRSQQPPPPGESGLYAAPCLEEGGVQMPHLLRTEYKVPKTYIGPGAEAQSKGLCLARGEGRRTPLGRFI
jgi:hypothetical protein